MSSVAHEDAPGTVRPGEELAADALERFVREHVPDAHGAITVLQFPRGFSNLTYLVTVGEREFVLRRPPFNASAKGGHDMVREYRILRLLRESGYDLAPPPIAVCEDTSVLGVPFYLMERVHGMIFRADVRDVAPADMRAATTALADALAALHRIDARATAFAGFGKPEGYIERQVRGWTERYAAARTSEPQPELERAFAWLAEHLPAPTRVSLVHNDFKLDNVVLDPANAGTIRAVLDWEMATVGDPLLDLGTSLGYWVDADESELVGVAASVPTFLPGSLTRVEFAERYVQSSGMDPGDLLFAYVFGICKIAVIVQQIYARYVAGYTRDERFAKMATVVSARGRAAEHAIARGTLK
jgi:aminoglycoside phosphotransferase (APT) family kinase protein